MSEVRTGTIDEVNALLLYDALSHAVQALHRPYEGFDSLMRLAELRSVYPERKNFFIQADLQDLDLVFGKFEGLRKLCQGSVVIVVDKRDVSGK